MQYMPVNISPMIGPSMGMYEDYTMENAMVQGVRTIMDPRVLELDMGGGEGPNKIYTFTYGNMIGGGPIMHDLSMY